VAVCATLTFYGAGTFFYGFSVFVRPMALELGWSMALISGAFSLYRLESGIGAPIAGFLLDRVGPRILVFGGGIVWGAGLVFLSQVTTVFQFYMAFILISLGWTFSSGVAVAAPLIGKWFIKRRGRALGFFTAVVGFSGVLVPLLSHCIVTYGWKSTLWVMGLLTVVIVVPLSFCLRHRPEDHGLLPDGERTWPSPEGRIAVESPAEQEVDISLKTAFGTPSFWILSACFLSFQMTMSALFVHLVPHLVTAGIDPTTASLTVTFITLSSVIGRAGFGWLSDIMSKKWLLISTFVLQAIGLFAFSQVETVIHLIPFLVTYAPSYGGSIVLRAAVAGAYFGRKNFGTVYGALLGMGTFGGVAGPVLAGFAYDVQGNYRLIFMLLALLSLLSALILLTLKRPDAYGRLASK
jgi:MFS family permease